MIRIPYEVSRATDILVGPREEVSNTPAPVFDAVRVSFLADLSRTLLAHPASRSFPDVVNFAYWCRRSNLTQLANSFAVRDEICMGLGLSFHICPSNVPVNFAFSLAFGLLEDNTCVLRLPSRASETADVLIEAIASLLQQEQHAPLADSILLTRFDCNDDLNRFWMSVADVRLVWGGDQTVQHMRALPCRPRSREVAFSDRYSLCAIAPHAVLSLDESGMRTLCNHLFNDLYLMDQAACSSPQLVAWVGDRQEIASAKAWLWPALAEFAAVRYAPRAVHVMDKYVQACRRALDSEQVVAVRQHGNTLYRVELSDVVPDQDERRAYFGTVHEVSLASLEQLAPINEHYQTLIAPIVNEHYQTLTYFGIDKAGLQNFVVSQRLRGIDRIVPVGARWICRPCGMATTSSQACRASSRFSDTGKYQRNRWTSSVSIAWSFRRTSRTATRF
ncbi:MAG: Coenzyme F390 synthetase [uncultured Paraburkholderia sp.]|nr:MAG: Coenzyme F390 synthetase [uncultured Paraburkholderia sp.]CAH2910078.1 MAG: Coenzyme F390 synthetase [uncultured Paraburkholderia sp.]